MPQKTITTGRMTIVVSKISTVSKIKKDTSMPYCEVTMDNGDVTDVFKDEFTLEKIIYFIENQ